jgi:hypothetical protein
MERSDQQTRREYRLPPGCIVRQSGPHLEVVNHRTRRIVRTVTPPAAWGDRWGWNTTEGGFYIECRHLVATTVTDEQAKALVPTMRAAVAALHEVWEKCREVERALGRDLDCLEGIIQDMAAGVDDAESIDVDYVRDAINAQADELVAETDACPGCGERNADNLVWQDDGAVKCSTCGKQYTPPAK